MTMSAKETIARRVAKEVRPGSLVKEDKKWEKSKDRGADKH